MRKSYFKGFIQNSWIEYLHPKLGYPVIARIEEYKKIEEKGYKIIKKVVNMECVYSEALRLFFLCFYTGLINCHYIT